MKNFLSIVLLLTLMIVAGSIESQAQSKTLLSSYGLSSDTVTNTATSYLELRAPQINAASVTLSVVCTEISGTTGGTITAMGSLDGTNYVALQVEELSTAIPTKTALDVASQNFLFRIKGNPCTHYRISWTGTGTMSASFTGQLLMR